ncbi:NAK/BIKE protein kinase [Podila verticillata NRRL 6337]|nr:NAK/BIKE protein kinase [Podila verticillata NRRL 6337]
MNVLSQGIIPPQGTILPGTTIQLGKYAVVIDRYIAEGGFAHVYVATPVGGGYPLVVKRIAAPDKERLAIVNSEIETMKRLGKHKNIVEYMDSCMGKLEGGGYEILILMEYCGGGPVIDLMNRRLQHRLTEPEILKIFSNVCEAVAYMHYSDPPILHRDIKVENIILSNNDYKLCDFGSATTNILRGDNIPRNVKDIQLLEEEINNHTTLQYRAPEMLDLYMRKGIDEKIDIWALGVLLYKLCYYTTPFEEQGQLAILNVRYTIPDHPVFSPAVIGLFQSMLQEDPRQRPNIYQVMKATSALRGLPCPIHNIYPDASFVPSAPDQSSATANILSNQALSRPMDVLPSIEPMRRGRPTRSPAAHTPSMTNDAGFAPQSDFNSGFDDSFGQFAPTSDPASQFSQLGGDAFDFGSSPTNKGQANGKRFTLDFESGKGSDEFGFKFDGGVEPEDQLSSKAPRPPSFNADDLLHPEPSSSSRVPAQPSGGRIPPLTSAPKATANDLFFSSSSDVKFNNDFGSRSGTPSSFGSNAPIGLSSPSSTLDSQSSGMSKPLLGAKQTFPGQASSSNSRGNTGYQGYQNSASNVLNRNVNPNGTGNSRYGSPAVSPAMSSSGIKNPPADPVSGKMASFELLQRQQMEQLGRFTSESQVATQNTQGKAKILDPSRTLDGMRSMDVNPRAGVSTLSTSPVLNPSFHRPAPANLPEASVDRKELARRDLDAEMKLIELQQKEFEKQQQNLINLQRQQLEEQQRQHRLQQEQLQKAQQEQIQRQHEKWQERKRMLQEQNLLSQAQALQQKDLERQHQSQTLEQQHRQQQEQLPTVSDLTSSLASTSLNTSPAATPSPSSSHAYRRSISGTGVPTGVVYPTPSEGRVSLDETPSVPVKSARRNVASGAATTSPATSTPTAALARSRRVSVNNPPPGQKPELLPKPTRFRMKDGTGTVMAGEEEAFRRKFPSTLDDDILLASHSSLPTSPTASSSTLSSSGYVEPLPQQRNVHVPVRKESIESFGQSTSDGSVRPNMQYRSPSQRARDLRGEVFSTSSNNHPVVSGSQYDDDDDDGEERLVRNRPRQRQQQQQQQQQQQARPETPSAVGGEDESNGPVESVRERVLRMNRVGRVV